MTSPSHDSAANRPLVFSPHEIDDLLSMTLIANLATLDDDESIHILPMWFLRIGNYVCIPTSRHTHKYRNLRARPHASVMIDISRAGLNLKGVLIRGQVTLIEGDEGRQINHSIHTKYVTPETIKIHMDHLVSWNLADSKAGKALSISGGFHPLGQ